MWRGEAKWQEESRHGQRYQNSLARVHRPCAAPTKDLGSSFSDILSPQDAERSEVLACPASQNVFPSSLKVALYGVLCGLGSLDRAEARAEVPRCCQKTKESKGAKQAAGFADLPGMPGHGPVEL